MIQYLWPIGLLILSSVFYNVTSKMTPENANPFLAVMVTYVIGFILSIVLFFYTRTEKNIMDEVQRLNWTSVVLGLSIVGLEIGNIYMYRAGWNISVGSLVVNIMLAIILVILGVFFYKESINAYKVVGIALCLVGLFFINKK